MTASDFLITNGGRLDPTWFAPHTLTDLLTAWLAATSGTDQAVEATVYARAYETLVSLIMAQPTSWRADDVAETRSDTQLAWWQRQAAYWRGRVDALAGDGGPALAQWEGDPVWRN